MFSRKTTFADKSTIIAHCGLNDSVRNGKRCDPTSKSGEQNIQIYKKYIQSKQELNRKQEVKSFQVIRFNVELQKETGTSTHTNEEAFAFDRLCFVTSK